MFLWRLLQPSFRKYLAYYQQWQENKCPLVTKCPFLLLDRPLCKILDPPMSVEKHFYLRTMTIVSNIQIFESAPTGVSEHSICWSDGTGILTLAGSFDDA